MLYLAEVKKQGKGFLPRTFKTELRLLAWQHNDKSWSAVQGEEVISSNEVPQTGEGVLLLVKLSQERQIEETPEVAAPELVRQLQRLSRLLEKLKDQRQEIEEWRESLTYQSEELSRRSLDVEARLEQFKESIEQLQFLEQQRQELEEGWNRLREAQQQHQAEHPLSLENFPGLTTEQIQSLQKLIVCLSSAGGGSDLLTAPLDHLWEILQSQQALLDSCRQELEQQQAMVEHWQQDLQHQEEGLALHQQELEEARASLQQSKIKFQGKQVTLLAKQELSRRLERQLQALEALKLTAERSRYRGESGNAGAEESPPLNLDLEALEKMPLEELQKIISQLEGDYAKLVKFVSDQEEELSLQTQTVTEIEAQLVAVAEGERFKLETVLAEELEKKLMLDRTLLGQRRNLREREKVLQAHRQILQHREGVSHQTVRGSGIDESLGTDTDILLRQLEDYRSSLREELQQLQGDIKQLQESLSEFAETIEQQEAEQQRRAEARQIEENNWQQTKLSLAQTQARLELYAQSLQPIQQRWQEIEQIWASLRAYV